MGGPLDTGPPAFPRFAWIRAGRDSSASRRSLLLTWTNPPLLLAYWIEQKNSFAPRWRPPIIAPVCGEIFSIPMQSRCNDDSVDSVSEDGTILKTLYGHVYDIFDGSIVKSPRMRATPRTSSVTVAAQASDGTVGAGAQGFSRAVYAVKRWKSPRP